MSVIEAVDLAKSYVGGDGAELVVLDGVDLRVVRGEMVAIIGASGTGKSTLLHILGALDRPTRGRVAIDGRTLNWAPESDDAQPGRGRGLRGMLRARARAREAMRLDREVSERRNRSIGFVFQFHHLLREFSALENVAMPLRIAGWTTARASARAKELLDLVGLAPRMTHRPAQMSGGEQQRTAVARALAIGPATLLADEPSGNLDHANGERLHDLLAQLARDLEIAMVIVTHNRSLASRAGRVLLMENGKLHESGLEEAVP